MRLRTKLLLILAGAGVLACTLAALFIAHARGLQKVRWNLVYSNPWPTFTTAPNEFLAEAVRGRRPGTALDLGMGQGRNAVFLAQQGWQVTGVDFSEVGVAQAREQARKAAVQLDAVLQDVNDFEFGKQRWDLIALIYFPPRPYVARIRESLKPGGLLVVECFPREAAQKQHIGHGVVFDTDELPKLFAGFRILRYEEVTTVADWGRERTRVVRLLAEKM